MKFQGKEARHHRNPRGNSIESIYLLYEETLESINLKEHFSADIISSTSFVQTAWPMPIVLKLFNRRTASHSCTNEEH